MCFTDEEDAADDDVLAGLYTEVKPKQVVQPKPRQVDTRRTKFRNPFRIGKAELKPDARQRSRLARFCLSAFQYFFCLFVFCHFLVAEGQGTMLKFKSVCLPFPIMIIIWEF